MVFEGLAIRRAKQSDCDLIVDFNSRLARETEERELDQSKIQPGVQALLEDPSRGVYYLAEHEGSVIGQIMITREWSDWRNGWFWWIQSLYVRADFRKQGVFKALYRHVEAEAAATDACGLRLYVDDDNSRAQAAYLKLGMDRSRYEFFEVEF